LSRPKFRDLFNGIDLFHGAAIVNDPWWWYPYPLEEFLADLDVVTRTAEGVLESFESAKMRTMAHMRARYERLDEANWKAVRLLLTMLYLAHNLTDASLTEVDIGDPQTEASDASIPREFVLHAVHEAYTQRDLPAHEPIATAILDRARELRTVVGGTDRTLRLSNSAASGSPVRLG
jgi:hypothetical protein